MSIPSYTPPRKGAQTITQWFHMSTPRSCRTPLSESATTEEAERSPCRPDFESHDLAGDEGPPQGRVNELCFLEGVECGKLVCSNRGLGTVIRRLGELESWLEQVRHC